MKFKVSRTSEWSDKRPCEEAIKETYTAYDIRTLNSFEEFDKKFGGREGTWLSKGINHCVNENGYIQREIPHQASGWFIEIYTLEELLNFRDKYGDVIITVDWNNPNIIELEIYDSYRE